MPSLTYNRRKEMGLCPACGNEPKPENGVYCEKCREKQRAKYKQRCMKETMTEKETRLDRDNRRVKSLVHKRRMQGLCGQCGAVSPLYFYCEVCAAKRKAWEVEQNDGGR